MSAVPLYSLDISIEKYIHGKELKALKPDKDGFYTVSVGTLGVPSRSGKLYDTPSYIEAMKDKFSAFYTQLIAGSLASEYGHPFVPDEWTKQQKIRRMCLIFEANMCGYFGRIWIDPSKSIVIDGFTAIPIYARIKPSGPMGNALKEQLEDPHHDSSFSVRTLSQPMMDNIQNVNSDYLNLLVKAIITYDFVYAPGMELASKRYAPHNEAYGFNFSFSDIEEAIIPIDGYSSENLYLNTHDLSKFNAHEEVLMHNGKIIGTKILGDRTVNINNLTMDAASLVYRRNY